MNIAIGDNVIIDVIKDGESKGGIVLPDNFRSNPRRGIIVSIKEELSTLLGKEVFFDTYHAQIINENRVAVKVDDLICINE